MMDKDQMRRRPELLFGNFTPREFIQIKGGLPLPLQERLVEEYDRLSGVEALTCELLAMLPWHELQLNQREQEIIIRLHGLTT